MLPRSHIAGAGNVRGHNNLGQALMKHGDCAEAQESFNAPSRSIPPMPWLITILE